MRFLILIAAVSLTVAGCSRPVSEKLAIMHNPETGQTAECKVDPWSTWEWQYKDVVDQCVAAYEKAGYRRMD